MTLYKVRKNENERKQANSSCSTGSTGQQDHVNKGLIKPDESRLANLKYLGHDEYTCVTFGICRVRLNLCVP